ncbi:type VI secretion system protein ImpL [Klebsiella pneumoniae]|nr:type VI secretion system protein ImpL [Klebsiella pneumoniae]
MEITPDPQLVSQSRQVLLQQIGRRNAESTLYENMLKSVRRNFADVTLEDMTNGTDARRLFTTDESCQACLPARLGRAACSRR